MTYNTLIRRYYSRNHVVVLRRLVSGGFTNHLVTVFQFEISLALPHTLIKMKCLLNVRCFKVSLKSV